MFKYLYDSFYQKRFHILITCFAILLNWAGHTFVYENSYRFLTFDMVGTFVVAMTLGTVWALIAAIVTPIVLSNITSPHFIYLAVINMTGAIVWGWLVESGNLILFNTKSKNKNTFKQTVSISGRFILFASILTGLVISFSSSVVKNIIFQDAIFKQPYSIYFTSLFKSIFDIDSTSVLSIFANYIAETFIEIPNIIITVLVGCVIAMTILKYNILMLTQHYEYKIKDNNISWFSICMSNISVVEFTIFVVSGYIYMRTVKSVSNSILTTIMNDISISSVHGFIFLEMIALPLTIIILILFLRIILPDTKKKKTFDLDYLKRNILNKKEFDSDINKFILTLFIISACIVFIYLLITVNLTGVTPIKYYQNNSVSPANVSNFLWLIILIITFILIDKYNNNLTRDITLENELIKKQTVTEVADSFDTQRQKLQALELNWSQDTVELLRSSRHDLINELEKNKTGLNDLLFEVYEKIVKPYKDAILENQKNTREHIEELGNGVLSKKTVAYIQENIKTQIAFYNSKLKPYIEITFENFDDDAEEFFCYSNRLLFVAINNILDNSIFALQKLLLDDNFFAKLNILLKLSTDSKNLEILITDNAGGVAEGELQKLYKEQVESSKGNRLGEGTIHAAYFVNILNGKISAANVVDADGNKGLQTKILIPIYRS